VSPKPPRQRPDPDSHLVRRQEPLGPAGDGAAARDTPAAPPVPQRPAHAAVKRSKPARPGTATTPPPEAVPALSKALLQRHIFALDAAFGKARAALNDYEGAMEQVVLVVADARRDEVDEDTIDSAAKRKHIQIPGES
jgi:hypothetical protein